MSIMSSAGSTLHVSSTLPTTLDETGFEAVTGWQAVGEIVDLGEFGKEYNLITHTSLGSRRVRKLKGSYNQGTLPLQMGRDTDDVGQALLITAQHSDASYSFKVTLQDGAVSYFTGKVMSYRTQVGSVDQITGATCNIEIDSDVVEVAAP